MSWWGWLLVGLGVGAFVGAVAAAYYVAGGMFRNM